MEAEMGESLVFMTSEPKFSERLWLKLRQKETKGDPSITLWATPTHMHTYVHIQRNPTSCLMFDGRWYLLNLSTLCDLPSCYPLLYWWAKRVKFRYFPSSILGKPGPLPYHCQDHSRLSRTHPLCSSSVMACYSFVKWAWDIKIITWSYR